MLYIPCPHCGLRNETEFHYGAEAGVGYPDPNALTDTEWAKYLHIRDNPKGWLGRAMGALCGMWKMVQPMAQYHHPRDRAGIFAFH